MRCHLCARSGGAIVLACTWCGGQVCEKHLAWDLTVEPAEPICTRCDRRTEKKAA